MSSQSKTAGLSLRQPAETPTSNSAKTRLWYDPKVRAIAFQVLTVMLLALFFSGIIGNALNNLESRGITTGFSFLQEPAGFGISQTLVEYSEQHSYGRTFVVGILNTLLVSVLGIALATVLGFVIGVARLSSNWLISRVAAAYIEIFRNIPLLLQIFFWYFAVLRALPSPRNSLEIGSGAFLNIRGLYLPKPIFESGSGILLGAIALSVIAVIGLVIWAKRKQTATGKQTPVFAISLAILLVVPTLSYLFAGSPISWDLPYLKGFNFRGGLTIYPELLALLFALSIYTASFIAEIVRSGIQAVPHGQTEASRALGLPGSRTMRLVIIPQALRVIIPPLTSQYLNLAKNSSLATAIGYPDLVSVFAGTTLNQTGQAIEVISMTMAVYLTISLVTSVLMNIYNRRKALMER